MDETKITNKYLQSVALSVLNELIMSYCFISVE
jgi:hypothetical protein